MEPDQNTQQSSLSPELEDASNKWAEKLRKYIDSNNKDAGITKIKEALSGLVKSGDIQKEQVKPFVNSVLAKAKVSDDIKQALLGAMTDLGVALSESITLEQATSILSSSSQQLNESLQVNSAFGIIVKDIMESLEYIEEAPLQPELDSIAEKWAQLLKKYHDKGQGKVAFEKIKGAISSLVKDGSLSKEQVKPFIKIVVGKSNIPKEAKDELLGISGESDTPKSIPGAISTIKKLSSTISTPEEAKQKATSALKKAGLSKKFEDYENKIHNWVSKIPLVGGWYSKQSQTKKRIILGVSIAVLATLAFMGVKWATNMLEGGSQATPSDKSSHMLDPRNFQRSSLDGLQTSIRDNFINDHGGSGKTVGMANGLIRVIAKDGAEIIMNTKENGDISVVDKAVDPEQFNSLANSAKNLKDLM
jgi:polyhydroxyalkanoate synthesis regulator phasin